jgi:hypothetical protein
MTVSKVGGLRDREAGHPGASGTTGAGTCAGDAASRVVTCHA